MNDDQLTPQKKPKIRYSLIKILTGSDLSRRKLPFMSVAGSFPGPTIWLTACMHGDEVGGQVVIQEVFKRLKKQLRNGIVNAFPLMNPIGFENLTRNITFSREDLNRSFPGDPNGTLGERIADLIFSYIKKTGPDLVLDLHNDWKRSIPYVLLDKKTQDVFGEAYQKARQISKSSGFYVLEDSDEIHSSLSHSLLKAGIPAITYELGESAVVNEASTEQGIASIMSVMAKLNMVDSREKQVFPLNLVYDTSQVLTYSDKPFCKKSGIIRFLVKPGMQVIQGQILAKTYNAFGKLQETLFAENHAIVLGTADSAVAYPGMSPMVFGILSEQPD